MLYITPSRGRPHNVAELIRAWEETRAGIAQLWVIVDDDDPSLWDYENLSRPDWVQLFVAPRKRLGPTLNDWSREGIDRGYQSIGFMGDDHRPRTLEWDRILADKINTYGSGVYYGNDLLQGRNLPTAVLMTADIVESLKYFCPPGMIHLYLDNAWKEIGEAVGNLTYVPHVVIEHVHPIAGKAEWDDLYKDVNSGEQYSSDKAVFDTWIREIPPHTGWRGRLSVVRG